jgi:uncharacterized protein HemX
MTRILGAITLLVLIAGLGLYAAGWLSWNKSADRTTIEIETKEIQRATEDAVEKGKQLVEESLDSFRSNETESTRTPDAEQSEAVDVEPVEPVEPR